MITDKTVLDKVPTHCDSLFSPNIPVKNVYFKNEQRARTLAGDDTDKILHHSSYVPKSQSSIVISLYVG